MDKHKNLIITLLCINALLTVILIYASFQSQPAELITQAPPEPLTEISNDLLLTTLQPYVNTAVYGHYKNINGYGITVLPEMMEIIELKRRGENDSFNFIVVIKVTPYTGAFRQLGEDRLTFEVNGERIYLTDYQHISDFPVTDYQNP